MSVNLFEELQRINDTFINTNYLLLSYKKELDSIRDEQNKIHSRAIEKRNELINDYMTKLKNADSEDKHAYYILIKQVDNALITNYS